LFAFPSAPTLEAVLTSTGLATDTAVESSPAFVHALTHLDMVIEPARVDVAQDWQLPTEVALPGVWVYPDEALTVGVPVPVSRILAGLVAARDAAR
jgi:adenine-specific DNA glycosylase